jgi:hypothetical protein
VTPPPIKEAIHRELRFGILAGLVADDHVVLDMRPSRGDGAWVIARRLSAYQLPVGCTRERWEVEILVRRDDFPTLHAIRTALLSVAGTVRTWGAFNEDGTTGDGGVRLRTLLINDIEDFDSTLDEQSSLLLLSFYHG